MRFGVRRLAAAFSASHRIPTQPQSGSKLPHSKTARLQASAHASLFSCKPRSSARSAMWALRKPARIPSS